MKRKSNFFTRFGKIVSSLFVVVLSFLSISCGSDEKKYGCPVPPVGINDSSATDTIVNKETSDSAAIK